MSAVRTLVVFGVMLACACGGSNVVFRGSDAGSEEDGTSGSGSGGSSSGSSGGAGSGSGSGGSSGSSSGGGSGSSSSSGGETCGACATDAECEQTCPAAATGSSNCCHVTLGTCYVVQEASCPSGSSSGGSSGGSGGSSSGGSSGGSGSSSGAMMCSNCATDAQCQLTCPPVTGGGTNCCETTLGICYATAAGTCPLPQDASTE